LVPALSGAAPERTGRRAGPQAQTLAAAGSSAHGSGESGHATGHAGALELPNDGTRGRHFAGQVQRLWAANDIKPDLSRTFKLSKDKQFEAKFWDVIWAPSRPAQRKR
jgi:hypothetical protein